jgi:hypothetical protein
MTAALLSAKALVGALLAHHFTGTQRTFKHRHRGGLGGACRVTRERRLIRSLTRRRDTAKGCDDRSGNKNASPEARVMSTQ